MFPLQGARIVVTGGNGFLGRAVLSELKVSGADKIVTFSSKEHDLREASACKAVVEGADLVIHLAAKVGGIGYNREHPGLLFYENAIMGIQLLEAARIAKVTKFVTIGTICAYPNLTPVPFHENDIWNGYPEVTNAPYGLAKKMLLVQSQAYRQEYGMNAIYLLPVNLYGPYDNFHPSSSHVIPALIKKVADAKREKSSFIEVWGTGNATREFIFVQDAARGIVQGALNYNAAEPVNIGANYEVSIKELIRMISELMEYQGEIRWDSSKPDGQPRRCLDTSRAREQFGFAAQTSLRDGLAETIRWYLAQE